MDYINLYVFLVNLHCCWLNLNFFTCPDSKPELSTGRNQDESAFLQKPCGVHCDGHEPRHPVIFGPPIHSVIILWIDGQFLAASHRVHPTKMTTFVQRKTWWSRWHHFSGPICSPGMQRVATRRYELVMPSDHTDPDKLLLILQRHPKFKVFGL